MKIRKPDYYDRFQCIAGACSDSCCIGWEIDVDEERRSAYREVEGALGERLRTCIDWEEGHFILQGKEERCPFLNSENLCDLIIGLGEESLCEICREHPRYYEWYEDLTEAGVGLCCEAAAKLILESEEPTRFVETWEPDEAEDSCEYNEDETDLSENEQTDDESDDTLEVLFEARETAYQILQNRSVSIWSRLHTFMNYIEELQQALDFENLDEVEESAEYYREQEPAHDLKVDYHKLIDCCRKLEPMDESWPDHLKCLDELIQDADVLEKLEEQFHEQFAERDYEYEHLAVYFVYRYFMKCRKDADVYSRGCLTAFCVALIHLLDLETFAKQGNCSKEDRAMNAKKCSKEIEYSEENLAILADLFWEHGFEEILEAL